jgi:hypothetical protein
MPLTAFEMGKGSPHNEQVNRLPSSTLSDKSDIFAPLISNNENNVYSINKIK